MKFAKIAGHVAGIVLATSSTFTYAHDPAGETRWEGAPGARDTSGLHQAPGGASRPSGALPLESPTRPHGVGGDTTPHGPSESSFSQGSPGDLQAQMTPGAAGSHQSPGGGRAQSPSSRYIVPGTHLDTMPHGASDGTYSEGSPGDLQFNMAPGTTGLHGGPGSASK